MIEILKEDIDALDFILETLVKGGYSVNVSDLKEIEIIKLDNDKNLDNSDIKRREENEFRRYLSIIEEYKCAECYVPRPFEEISNAFITANPKTFHFYKQGGFKKVYSDLKEKRRQDKIEINKSKVDLKLAKETLKEFPRTKWFARIGFLIAILLALKEIFELIFL